MKHRQPCTDCGCLTSRLDFHHEPPRCEGGTRTVPLCRDCHVARHSERGDWKRWGRKGGQRTAANPENWMRNLKQYRTAN